MGSTVAVSAPDSGLVERRLWDLGFLAVEDYFLSETAQLADVLLPSAHWAEEEGAMTNVEGRVIRRRAAFAPQGEARTDLDIIQVLAARLGKGRFFSFPEVESVFEELGRASACGPADYSGMSYGKIAANQGLFWFCPSGNQEGTARMFTGSFPTANGKAKFHPVHHQPSGEEPDEEYPLYLTTGRALAQYQSGS